MFNPFTPIYPADILPVRSGWYLTRPEKADRSFSFVLTYWSTDRWIWPEGSALENQRRDWVGFMYDPIASSISPIWVADDPPPAERATSVAWLRHLPGPRL